MSQQKAAIETLLEEARELTYGQSAHRLAKNTASPLALPDFGITDEPATTEVALIQEPESGNGLQTRDMEHTSSPEVFYWEQSNSGSFSCRRESEVHAIRA